MTQHVADRIVSAVETQLASIPALSGHVFLQPLHSISESDLPAAIIEDVEDEVVAAVGFFPVEEQHQLRFSVFVCHMTGASGFRAAVAALHHDLEMALVGSIESRSLGGLLTVGLQRGAATYAVDSDSLQKPVGGWRIPFICTYFLRSNAPGNVEKE